MSLKKTLNNLIKDRYPDIVKVDEIEYTTKEMGYKISNAERRLRKSESPNIEALKNGKGNIYAYKYKPERTVYNSEELKVEYDKAVENYKKIMSFENAFIVKMIDEIRTCKYENIKKMKMENVITEINKLIPLKPNPQKKTKSN